MLLTREKLLEAVGARAFSAGDAYFRQGRVLRCEESSAGTISASVRGSERKPYNLTIEANGGSLYGECSCPVGLNCKHVAAAGLKWLSQSMMRQVRDMIHEKGIMPGRSAAPVVRPALQFSLPPATPPERLPYTIESWLSQARRRLAPRTEVVAPRKDVIVFLLKGGRPRYGTTPHWPYLALEVGKVPLLKTGQFSSSPKRWSLSAAMSAVEGNPEMPEAELIRMVHAVRHQQMIHAYDVDSARIEGVLGAELLKAAMATGRLFVERPGPAPVTMGEPVEARFAWEETAEGGFRPAIKLVPEGPPSGPLFLSDGLVMHEAATGTLRRVILDVPSELMRVLIEAPEVPPGGVAATRRAMTESGLGLEQYPFPEAHPVDIIKVPPVPYLTLRGVGVRDIGQSGWRGALGPTQLVGAAEMSFEYPMGHKARYGETVLLWRSMGAERRLELHRDFEAEMALVESIIALGFEPLPMLFDQVPQAAQNMVAPVDGDIDWLAFLHEDKSALEALGWQITIDQSFPVRLVQPDGDVAIRLKPGKPDGSGIDWFALDLGVVVDGKPVDLTDLLVALIGRAGEPFDEGELFYMRLQDGRILALPGGRMKALFEALVTLIDGTGPPSKGVFRVDRSHAADLAALEAAGGVWEGGDALRTMGRVLREQGGMPSITVPDRFLAALRPYQQQGLDWLHFLKSHGFGAILADDMGLGKTVQTLALLAEAKAGGALKEPVLVIAPTSLLPNWQREAAKFAPDLSVMVSHGLGRKKGFDQFTRHDLVITSYPLLTRDHAALTAQHWAMLILDEAQTLKNPDAEMSRRVRELQVDWRLALSGTPIENSLSELWSLFTILNPGLLGDRKSFQKRYRTPIEKKGDKHRAAMLSARVRPFILRRTKEQVAKDLPPKTMITEAVEIGEAQRDLYESIRLLMQKKVREALAQQGLAKSHIIILDALLKLRQAALDPRLVKGGHWMKGVSVAEDQAKEDAPADKPSAKLDRLMEMITTLIEESRRIVVFSQFTSMLDLIAERLDAADIAFVRLDGDSKDRGAIIERFQKGRMPVFLASLKAGGVGLNLTAADCVLLFDPWWNPAVEDQAIDRVHRIGQDKPVFVYRLIATSTIEEKMDLLKERKRSIAATIFDADGQVTPALTAEDIEALLG